MNHEQTLSDRQLQKTLLKLDHHYHQSKRWRARCIYSWIAIGALVVWLVVMATVCAKGAETYTVTVADGFLTFTNSIAVVKDHHPTEPGCTLIRYVEKGVTNEFHAWLVPVTVKTNKPASKTFHSRASLPQRAQRLSGPSPLSQLPLTPGSAAFPFESGGGESQQWQSLQQRRADPHSDRAWCTYPRQRLAVSQPVSARPALILSPANLAKDCQCTEWSRVGGR